MSGTVDISTLVGTGLAFAAGKLGINDLSLGTAKVPNAPTTTGLAARFREHLSLVADFGAVADATLAGGVWSGTDNAAAFQAAHDYAVSTGGACKILVPNGHYRINSPVSLTASVTFEGVGFAESTATAPVPGAGSWICIGSNFIGNATSPFTFSGTAVNGSAGFRNFGISEGHPPAASGWSPNAYPPVFSVTGTGGTTMFREIYAFPVNKLFSFYNTARFDLDVIMGQVFTWGIFINLAEDASRIGRTHFWPFWSADPNVLAWQQANGDAIWVQRMDGLKGDYLFMIFYRSGLRLDTSSAGPVNDALVDTLYADGCKYPLWVTDSAASGLTCTAQINQLYTGGETIVPGAVVPSSTAIQVDGQTQLQIGNARLYECAIQAINFTSTTYGSIIMIANLIIQNWNVGNIGAPAISAVNVTGTAHEVRLAQQPVLIGGNGGGTVNSPAEVRVSGAKLYQIATGCVSGGSYSMSGWMDTLFLVATAPGTLSSFTVTLPRYPYDGDEFAIYSEDNITTLSVSSYGAAYEVDCPGASSGSVTTGLTSLIAYQKRVFKFCVTIIGNPPRWFQIQ